ncbi:MAG: hypothetical protein U9O83_04725 [Campylobacterota bacterium]|nr:hypothetical protein [Campylobacterota bacterium]
MVKINWDEYKLFKKHSHKDDNFTILLDFMKSYYNMTSPMDVYDTLSVDDIGQMMLEKRDIIDAEGLESYLFKLSNG